MMKPVKWSFVSIVSRCLKILWSALNHSLELFKIYSKAETTRPRNISTSTFCTVCRSYRKPHIFSATGWRKQLHKWPHIIRKSYRQESQSLAHWVFNCEVNPRIEVAHYFSSGVNLHNNCWIKHIIHFIPDISMVTTFL